MEETSIAPNIVCHYEAKISGIVSEFPFVIYIHNELVIKHHVVQQTFSILNVKYPKLMRYCFACMMNGIVYICGDISFDVDNSLFALDLKSENPSWNMICNAPSQMGVRTAHGFVARTATKTLVLFGGMLRHHTRLSDMFEYDLDSQWKTVAYNNKEPPVRCAFACQYDAQMDALVMGCGFDGKSPMNDIWVYHFATKLWNQLQLDYPQWIPPRTLFTNAYGHGCLYLCKGGSVAAKDDPFLYIVDVKRGQVSREELSNVQSRRLQIISMTWLEGNLYFTSPAQRVKVLSRQFGIITKIGTYLKSGAFSDVILQFF